MKAYLSLVLFLLLTTGSQAQIVNTQFGQVQGHLNGNTYQFLGIPFAKPPVDSLRWKAPQSPNIWPGILATTKFAPVCPQKNYTQFDTTYTLEGNEDCLYLNVWTPQTDSGNRPVMVFIHGGGNQQGSASQITSGTELYNGKNLAERGDVVVVTIQYRLGPLGFLVHPGLEVENTNGVSGNYAVLDQILALKWVQNNISNFGGDPSRVMIFGESAGGVNVGNLLTTPLASGLFQRACIQSAIPVIDSYNDSKQKGMTYVDSFTISGTDVQKIAYMRTLPSDSLLHFESSAIVGGVVQTKWRPVVDDEVFHNYPLSIFQSGNYNKVPLIIGSNADEMSLSVPQTILPYMVTALINSMIPPAYRAQALALYPPGSNATEARTSYVGILTDAQFTTTTRRAAQCISLNQTETVWRYFFTYKHTIPQLAALGSYHGMELFYVFNNWENTNLGRGILFKPEDDSVQKNMLSYWVNFAKTGDPNSNGLEPWNPYQSSTDCYLEINATPDGKQCGLRTSKSNLWDAIIGFRGCSSTVGLAETIDSRSLLISPNPTNGYFYLDIPKDLNEYEVNVYNCLGQNINRSATSKELNLSKHNNGIYYIEVITKAAIYKGKVIKTD